MTSEIPETHNPDQRQDGECSEPEPRACGVGQRCISSEACGQLLPASDFYKALLGISPKGSCSRATEYCVHVCDKCQFLFFPQGRKNGGTWPSSLEPLEEEC